MTHPVASNSQLTAISVYQEFLAKTLTDKFNNLNVQMDRLINEANSELDMANQKLNGKSRNLDCRTEADLASVDMQIENERLRNDNSNLVAAIREKSRKHQQTQELYDRLKRKEMTAATQSAAYDSLDDVLGAASSIQGLGHSAETRPTQPTLLPRDQRRFQPFDVGFSVNKQPNVHQRRDSGHSQGSGGMMPPPPLRRPASHEMNVLGKA